MTQTAVELWQELACPRDHSRLEPRDETLVCEHGHEYPFVDGIPVDLEHAAMIDGCGRTKAFFVVTFPLLAPGLVASGVYAFLQAWNEFTLALVVMTREYRSTLPLWLSQFADTNRGTDWGAVMAGSTLIAISVVVFFLIVQGRMVSGLTAGAVKG